MSRGALLLLLLATTAASCQRSRSNAQMPAVESAAPDTMIGTISEVGADPATWLAIQPSGGGPSMRLAGEATAGLRNVAGAEVWLSGTRRSDDFRVADFEVRRVNNQPVDDGVVIVGEGSVAIRMRSGIQRSVPHAPPALREMAGARVWISRPVADRAPSFGLIQLAR